MTCLAFTLHYISSFLFLFYYERTRWKLFHKHVIRTTLYIFVPIFILLWAYLMKDIRYAHSKIQIEMKIYNVVWMTCLWNNQHVIRTTLYIFVSIFILLWAYLMKVIPQTRHSHYTSYHRFHLYFTMSVPDEGHSPKCEWRVCGITFIRYAHSKIKIETKIANVLCEWRVCGITFIKYAHSKIKIEAKIYIVVRLWAYLMKVIPQTRHSHNTLAIFVSIFILLWAYLMKVIPQTRHSV
jgi:hypothetical protein